MDFDIPPDWIGERAEKAQESLLGDAAEKFLLSPLGKYVARRALDEMYAIMEQLTEVDPMDHVAIIKLQCDHRVALTALSWLKQAVIAGQQADARLEAMDLTD